MLPPGLGINPNTGAINGTPTTPGTYTGTIQAVDSAGNTFQLAFSLTVVPAPSFSTPPMLPQGEVGVSYNQLLAAVGGTPPYSNFQVIN
jgi:hypothetical protein